jgi:G3E family GTPase
MNATGARFYFLWKFLIRPTIRVEYSDVSFVQVNLCKVQIEFSDKKVINKKSLIDPESLHNIWLSL